MNRTDKTWIVVAHKGGARLVDEHDEALRVRETLQAEPRTRSDAPKSDAGRAPDSRGHRAPEARDSSKEHPSVVFANLLADRLRKHRVEGDYTELVLIAAPQFLGLLRNALDSATSSKVRGTLDKDFGRLKDRDLLKRLEKL